MSTDTQVELNQGQQETTPDKDPSQELTPEQKLEKLSKDFEEIRGLTEKQKNEINGLNRRNSELESERKKEADEIEKKRLALLDEDQRKDEELKKIKEDRERLDSERREFDLTRIKEKSLSSAGLPLEFVSNISGDDEASIEESVKVLNERIQQQSQQNAEAEINKRFGGKPPVKGQGENDQTLQGQYDEAKKSNNTMRQLQLKRQASSEGLIIN